MEKLQRAIEKAREQRSAAVAQTSPKKRATSNAASPQHDDSSVREAWAELEPIVLNRKGLLRDRIVSMDGGPEAQPYDMLRTRIAQQVVRHGWKRIAITSPDAGSGKTTTAANLAFCFERQRDMRTMVFDFDLRRSGLSKLFGQNTDHSVSDMLEGRVGFDKVARRYGEGVALALNREPVRNPAEILQSRKTVEVLDEVQEMYQPDIMLFDLPPMMANDDNFAFLKNVDCALLLVGAEKTSLDRVDVTERQIAEITNILGIVLNKSRYTTGTYGYDYGHY